MQQSVNNSILVSVVMTAYNEQNYIKESIQSVLNQTHENIEFIIVNDGSTDDTEKIIKTFDDERIVYIKNDFNIGLIGSLNRGFDQAKGKYIARMDADDICLEERIQKQVSFMEANPDIGISGAQLLVFGSSNGFMKYPISDSEIRAQLLITSSFGNNVVILRKELFENHSLYFDKKYLHAEDYKCWTQWLKYTKGANMDEVLVKYRSHQNSVSNKHRLVQRKTRNLIRKEYLNETFFDIKEDGNTILNYTDKVGFKRAKALNKFIQLNRKQNKFESNKFLTSLKKCWYLDSLEEVEVGNYSVFIKYLFIYFVDTKGNLKQYFNLFKHLIYTWKQN